jgi:hypothetical protein
MRTELTWIKNIRNVFAHTSAKLNFDTEEIALICERLFIPTLSIWGGVIGPVPETNRQKFRASIQVLVTYFHWEPTDEPIRYKDSNVLRLFSIIAE